MAKFGLCEGHCGVFNGDSHWLMVCPIIKRDKKPKIVSSVSIDYFFKTGLRSPSAKTAYNLFPWMLNGSVYRKIQGFKSLGPRESIEKKRQVLLERNKGNRVTHGQLQ